MSVTASKKAALKPEFRAEDPTHVPSRLPPDRNWRLVWSDEFDGDTLDRSKWGFRLHLMQQRHNTFSEGGAVLDGKGNLLLTLQERDGHYYAPHLQTGSNFLDRPGEAYGKFKWPIAEIEKPRFLHKYGYYEARCKLPTQPGWWVAFWLQSPTIGATLDPAVSGVELDIMENFTRDGVVSHCNHWNGYGADHRASGSGKRTLDDTPDGFHVFGLDWSRNGYVYYIDGKESWRVDAPPPDCKMELRGHYACYRDRDGVWRSYSPVSDCEQFILISAECNGYRQGDLPSEELRKAVLPDYFVVDYVRVFDEIPE